MRRPRDEGAQRRERLFQRVGLMRIIDEDRRAAPLADALQPPGRAFEASSAANTGRRRAPVAMQRPAATSALETWKSPGKRQQRLKRAARHVRG